jgi:hypothetical protein
MLAEVVYKEDTYGNTLRITKKAKLSKEYK